MGACGLIMLLIPAVLLGYAYYKLSEIAPTPEFEDTWWGPGDPSKEDTSIKPFQISVPNEVLTDLTDRLNKARKFVPPLEGAQQNYGINTNLLQEIVTFWKTKYNWREREKFLNQYPQFTVSVQGLKIHYLHVKPKQTNGLKVVPIVLFHGWPGSVREFYEMIPLLTTPQKGRDFVFEVIAPSLPGYAFSQAAVRPGMGASHMAVLFVNFMKRLGYDKYYLHGGDWGSFIVHAISAIYPEHVLGVHSNMCFVNSALANIKWILGSIYPPLIVDKKHEHKMYPVTEKLMNTYILESGYMHIQATKPDTVGVGLNDSPVGLAAYMLEKFTTWTNPEWKNLPDGGLTKKFTYTQLLDNVMIYWVTGSITTSMRLYAETFNKDHRHMQVERLPIDVPSACARFSHELVYQPSSLLKEKFRNLLHESDYEDGGHFAGFELPDVMASDIYTSVNIFEKHHKESKQKSEL